MKSLQNLYNQFNLEINIENNIAQNLDKKHLKVISAAHKQVKNVNNFLKNFREWSCQSDFSSPPQISIDHLRILGLKEFIILAFKKILFFRNRNLKRAFMDDLKILEISKASKMLKKNPVHKTPGCKSFFKFRGGSSNNRWNRYAYISHKIISKQLMVNSSNHLDIGSYYGGLQSFLKKDFPESNFFMVDFSHQLLRSYIFLNQLFPYANHVLVNKKKNINFKNLNNSFVYIPVNEFDLLKNVNFHLITNFFSFGEMKKSTFLNYFFSKCFSNSKNIYLVNRFVSSPFFEKTYDSDITVVDYLKLKNHKIKYFDIFPMGHYHTPNRLLFGTKEDRPLSSPYFEMILENESWR